MRNRNLRPIEMLIVALVFLIGGGQVSAHLSSVVGGLMVWAGIIILLFSIAAAIKKQKNKKTVDDKSDS